LDKITVREITLFGILGAMTFAAKYVMAVLPNIEPVSLMVMLFAVTFGAKALYPIFLYVAMEILFYGLGTWNVMYLYIWPCLGILAWGLREMKHPLGWAVLSGAFGLLFGAMCMPVDMVIGGPGYALSKWISGIPFDMAHCIGNFVMALILFSPMRTLMEKMNQG
jgi:energy-coupling factor transport system substrate-specific component